jgi:hypothetical protein
MGCSIGAGHYAGILKISMILETFVFKFVQLICIVPNENGANHTNFVAFKIQSLLNRNESCLSHYKPSYL